MGKQHKIIGAVHLIFKHKDFKGRKAVDIIRQDITVLSGNNYYVEQENWVFRERARQNCLYRSKTLSKNRDSGSKTNQEYRNIFIL
jgi:hypothetical protein